ITAILTFMRRHNEIRRSSPARPNRDLLRLDAEPLLPYSQGVGAGRDVADDEMAGCVCYCIIRIASHIPPTLHPVMCIAGDLDNLRLFDGDTDLFLKGGLG